MGEYVKRCICYIPVSLIMIRRKNALFAHFHGKLAKLKMNNNKYIKNKQKIQKKILKKKIFNKKVVPAITDICTGGQLCKYQLLGSGVNISYYLHGGELFCYCSKKI